MPRVVIVETAKYDYEVVRAKFFEMADAVAGGRIGAGMRVLIKPNLLAPASPEDALLTHPAIVRAAVQYVLEKGAVPVISDSPAMGSFEKVLKESGIRAALDGLDVELREFKTSVVVDAGEPFHRLEIAEEALRADAIINLPKLKTHGQMLLTLGVKNLFGCVVGLRKPEWHLRMGVDREMFARMLVHIYKVLKPSITILDGILAMEGRGPGKGGKPKPLGLLLGSDDALALDITVCRILGLQPDSLLTNKMGLQMELAQVDDIELRGALPRVRGFQLPDISPVVFGPAHFHGLLRKHLVQRPVSDASLCRLCGDCWKYCPAHAISRTGKEVHFDYDKCIRCYCCLEVCPHGALSTEEPLAGKILRKLVKK